MSSSKFHHIEILAAFSTSILYILGAYSFAYLIFKGPLLPYLGYGFNLIMISNIIGCLFAARYSSLPIMLSLLQTSNIAIFVLISSALVGNISAISGNIDPIYTIYSALIFISIIAGGILWVLGKYKMGNIIRFVPYPVIVAFLAASGWILISSSIHLIIGKMPDIFSENSLNSYSTIQLIQLVLCIFIVAVMIILQKRYNRSFIMPAVYIAALLAFHLFLYFTGTSFEQFKLIDQSNIEKFNHFTNPLELLSLSKTQWSAFLDWNIIGNIAAIFIITPLFLLVTLNGIEKETQHEFKYDHELKYTGISNIVLALVGGGATVSPTLSGTLRNYQMGVKSRWIGVYVAAFLLSAFVLGFFLLESIPLFIVASIPLMSGVSLVVNWLFESKNKLSKLDYVLLWFVFLVIVFKGFLIGICLGVVASLLLFDYRYGQASILRNTLTGLELQSNNERGMASEALLKNFRAGIEIIILQGYLFFGNINTLIEKLIFSIENSERAKLYFIILDFRNVQGMDPSSAESFLRLYRHASEQEIKIIFTHLPKDIFHNILRFLNLPLNNDFFLRFANLDYGLEWCEEYFLKQKTLNWGTYFAGQLSLIFPVEKDLQMFSSYLKHLTIPENNIVFSEGDYLNEIYFLDTGRLDLIYKNSQNHKTRIKTIYPGVFFGETSLYLGMKQIFTCVSRSAASLYSLSFENLIKMEEENPRLALTFHRYMVCQTLNRLTHTHKTILSLI